MFQEMFSSTVTAEALLFLNWNFGFLPDTAPLFLVDGEDGISFPKAFFFFFLKTILLR